MVRLKSIHKFNWWKPIVFFIIYSNFLNQRQKFKFFSSNISVQLNQKCEKDHIALHNGVYWYGPFLYYSLISHCLKFNIILIWFRIVNSSHLTSIECEFYRVRLLKAHNYCPPRHFWFIIAIIYRSHSNYKNIHQMDTHNIRCNIKLT